MKRKATSQLISCVKFDHYWNQKVLFPESRICVECKKRLFLNAILKLQSGSQSDFH